MQDASGSAMYHAESEVVLMIRKKIATAPFIQFQMSREWRD
jgi:hypothetical protein